MTIAEQALQLLNQGRSSEADQLLAEHLTQNSADTEAWYMRAHINLAAEFPDAALRFITHAIAARPAEPSFYVLGGDAAHMQGDAEKATTFYMHALRHAQGDLVVLLRLFHILLLRTKQQRELMPAITQIIGQLHQQALDAPICAQIASAFASIGDTTESVTWFERAAHKAEDIALKNRYRLENACLLNNEAAIAERLGFYTADDATLGHSVLEKINTPLPTMPKEGLTCVVTTNLTKKLQFNKAKAPPKLDLLAETVASWQAALQPAADTRVIIFFDQPKIPDDDAALYAKNLATYCESHGFELMLRTGNGLKNNVKEALALTETAYFTLLEHDFLFHNCPPQQTLIDLLHQHSFLHLIQFNRRPNVAVRKDAVLWPETRVAQYPLLRTPRFSNNPYVGRTAKIMRDFLPIFSGANAFDGSNGGAGGLEEQVDAYMASLVQKFGYGFAQRFTGYVLYGSPLDAPRLTHTGI